MDLDNESRTDGTCLPVTPVVVQDGLRGWRVVTPQGTAGRPDVLGHARCSLGYRLDDAWGVR